MSYIRNATTVWHHCRLRKLYTFSKESFTNIITILVLFLSFSVVESKHVKEICSFENSNWNSLATFLQCRCAKIFQLHFTNKWYRLQYTIAGRSRFTFPHNLNLVCRLLYCILYNWLYFVIYIVVIYNK